MPLTSEEIPWGVAEPCRSWGPLCVPGFGGSRATVIANGDAGPLLATTQYGMGDFIYHGAIQPLIGHGGYDSGLYAYLIFRNAIEWAFDAANLPIVKLSPWRYEYDAAFIVRHDFENIRQVHPFHGKLGLVRTFARHQGRLLLLHGRAPGGNDGRRKDVPLPDCGGPSPITGRRSGRTTAG